MIETTDQYQQLSDEYKIIEKAIQYLDLNYHFQPQLTEVAESVGLSEFYFQRLFTHWVGISPKRFLQYLTKEHVKHLLDQSESLLSASLQVGLSGPGRLHDLFVVCDAVTPGEYKKKGENLTIFYGIHPTPFGDCLIGQTDRGVCYLAFIDAETPDSVINQFKAEWSKANLFVDDSATERVIEEIFNPERADPQTPLHLFLRGTNFQLKVWEALLRIPAGHVVSYEDIAVAVGAPRSMRAVGNAVGRNPIPYLIPCHRVVRKVGDFGNYRYGQARKKAMLGWEMAHQGIEVTG